MNSTSNITQELFLNYKKDKKFLKKLNKIANSLIQETYVSTGNHPAIDLKTNLKPINDFFEAAFKDQASSTQKKLIWDALRILNDIQNDIIAENFVFSAKAISGFYTYFLQDKETVLSGFSGYNSNQSYFETVIQKKLSGQVFSAINPMEVKNLSSFLQNFYFDKDFHPQKDMRIIDYIIEQNKYFLVNNLLNCLKEENGIRKFYDSIYIKLEETVPDLNKLNDKERTNLLQFIEQVNYDRYMIYPLKSFMFKNEKFDDTLSPFINSYFKLANFNDEETEPLLMSLSNKNHLITDEILNTIACNPYLIKQLDHHYHLQSQKKRDEKYYGLSVIVMCFEKDKIETIFKNLKELNKLSHMEEVYICIKSNLKKWSRDGGQEKINYLEKILFSHKIEDDKNNAQRNATNKKIKLL